MGDPKWLNKNFDEQNHKIDAWERSKGKLNIFKILSWD